MFFEDLNKNETLPTLKKDPITRVQLVKYAGASGDFNPLHTVEEVGEKAGTGLIAHGMLIMGMASQGVTSWIPRKYITRLKVRFKKMTYPNEEIQVSGKVVDKVDGNRVVGEVTAMNNEGEIKVSGTFEAILPTKA